MFPYPISFNTSAAGTPFANTKSLVFDGTDDYVDISPFTFTGEFSISCWVNFDALSNDGMVLGDSASGVTNSFIWAYNTTKIYVNVAGSTTTFNNDGVAPIVIGNWHHVALWRDSSDDFHLYIDNANFGTTSIINQNNANTFTLNRLGSAATAGGYYLNGNMDEVSLYDYALTSENITTIYNSGTPRVPAPLNIDGVKIFVAIINC